MTYSIRKKFCTLYRAHSFAKPCNSQTLTVRFQTLHHPTPLPKLNMYLCHAMMLGAKVTVQELLIGIAMHETHQTLQVSRPIVYLGSYEEPQGRLARRRNCLISKERRQAMQCNVMHNKRFGKIFSVKIYTVICGYSDTFLTGLNCSRI